MRKFKIAMAFTGIIIGAGFASGQEMLQYFTSFGIWGIVGTIVSIFIFGFFGFVIVDMGHFFKAYSHRDVLNHIVSPITNRVIDIFLLLTLFGIGVVMVAGAGSNLNQQFGWPIWLGNLICVALVFLVGMMNTEKVVGAIGAIAPFLIILVIVISFRSLSTADWDFAAMNADALELTSPLPNWWVSVLNYASVNLTTGVATAFLLGGVEKDKKVARHGGLIGGIVVGCLIVLINLTLFATSAQVATFDLPMLQMARLIQPWVGLIMSILIFFEIWNTAMSVLYSFSTSFITPNKKNFRYVLLAASIAAFALSFGGFTNVIGFVYPAVGYGGSIIYDVGEKSLASFFVSENRKQVSSPVE
ncbi:YkvI family membrane protein [Tetragenococcus koreensis]|uniref:Membrane protein YkvI n=1 Tax=Tetragenococcus koreensis TaxID=290335 RepID=A0AAN4UC40_9ENTE|nr:hypothetical protein [Tetragenococcus koreensis]GEQ49706.1 hypothetical protein TK11N_15580 [Tetragenococcus koreensis]GEQ52193.1 hypothetical protein TK12N_15370 [Tetragenococcus koreensis]GEQ54687.1 hypothetical protein TK2N_15310 [Tetragenococcus koreensis]GEQ57154.1 hypothetical protein TK4N_14970 [Tetragenococcus koreensis]GEQ59760.1 hypothetical protein TK6N_15990 [Tetragenococcus koreensis]